MESVEDYMTTNHPFCLSTDSIQNVSRKMIESNATEIIVVDDEKSKHPVGIVFEHDINDCCVAQGKDPRTRTSEDCMRRLAVTIKASMSPEQCFNILETNHLSTAPVVNERDEFCGFVSREDLADVFSD